MKVSLRKSISLKCILRKTQFTVQKMTSSFTSRLAVFMEEARTACILLLHKILVISNSHGSSIMVIEVGCLDNSSE